MLQFLKNAFVRLRGAVHEPVGSDLGLRVYCYKYGNEMERGCHGGNGWCIQEDSELVVRSVTVSSDSNNGIVQQQVFKMPESQISMSKQCILFVSSIEALQSQN